jgi:3-hydroxyisobutyrate dehydrogenase-like beta-hydroxyacid dehydrogenase
LLIAGKASGGSDGEARRHRRHWHQGRGDDPQLRPEDAAEKAEILIASLPNGEAFEQVMAGRGGIASELTGALDQGRQDLN